MGGQTDFMCDQTTTAVPQLAGKKIKPVAVLGKQALPQLPGVGTAADAGLDNLDLRSWNALFAPSGTPAPVMQRLQAALSAAVQDPDFTNQMKMVGVDLASPAEAQPEAVAGLIAKGLKTEVPALQKRMENLN